MKQFWKQGDQSFRKQEIIRRGEQTKEVSGGVVGTWPCCSESKVPPDLMHPHVCLIQFMGPLVSSVQQITCSEYQKKRKVCLFFLGVILIIISQRKQNVNTMVITKGSSLPLEMFRACLLRVRPWVRQDLVRREISRTDCNNKVLCSVCHS